MRVLVVARTRMGSGRVCVGGIDVESRRSLRLLGSDRKNLSEEHPIRPGEMWELQYEPLANPTPPHVEDVVVSRGRRVDPVSDLAASIRALDQPWRCALDAIFEGCLGATDGGSAFVARGSRLPSRSTGFWVAEVPLHHSQFEEHGTRYWVPDGDAIRSIKYVGLDDPIELIPRGTLVRFSLARWAEFPPGVGEQRCYLQLSASYA